MPVGTKYVFMASMDVAPEKEALFNEVYDQEHIPNLLEVPGVLAVTRVRSEPFAFSIGGERKPMPAASPRYTAIYELQSPDVLTTEAWAKAVETGRWPGEVRPFTSNRQHQLAEVVATAGG